jgi:hypothetical protein
MHDVVERKYGEVPPGLGLGIGLDPEMFKRRDVTVECIGA